MTDAPAKRQRLKALLAEGRTLVAPGAFDALSAKLIERAGFPLAYIGSYATAASLLGLPDVGLLTLPEMAGQAREAADAVAIPVLADGENGWNNAANLWRSVREFEQAGLAGIHLEDHEFGKHAPVPQKLLPLDDMLAKLRAALEAREDNDFLIIARTDAAWAFGDVEEAVRRMTAFAEAGADMVFPAGLSPPQLAAVRSRIPAKVMITDTPGFSVAEEEKAGADIVLYYAFALYAAFDAVAAALARFKATRDADAVAPRRAQAEAFEAFIGYADFVARAKRFGLA